MRYLSLAVYVVVLAIVLFGLEAALRLSEAGVSLTDSRGVGQVGLLTVVFASLMAFVHWIAGVNPFHFVWHYAARWRRGLAGFATMAGGTLLLSATLFAIFVAFGRARWSSQHWQALDASIVFETLGALCAALILAMTEELIFRATVMRYLRYETTIAVTVMAILASAAIFALSHLVAFGNAPEDMVPLMIGLFLLGVVLATTYVVTGSIACSIGIHFGLLGFKVILRETGLGDFGGDVRTGIDFYLLMLAIAGAVLIARAWLWRRFAIEPAALLEEDLRHKRISSF